MIPMLLLRVHFDDVRTLCMHSMAVPGEALSQYPWRSL